MIFSTMIGLTGCTQDNQSSAKIEGVVPNDGKTAQQRRADMNKGMDPKAYNYSPNSGNSNARPSRK